MGWGNGVATDGKKIGYNVLAKCEHPGCEKDIDRGLAFACGDNHEGGEDYCDGYFCYEHLLMTLAGQRCPECARLVPEDEEDDGKPQRRPHP